VSVVGPRAATAYGSHVAIELSAELAGGGWTVISGGSPQLRVSLVPGGPTGGPKWLSPADSARWIARMAPMNSTRRSNERQDRRSKRVRRAP
jgi:DNA processing protein